MNEKNSSKQVYDLFKEWGIKETETVDFSTFQKFYQTIVGSNKWFACNVWNVWYQLTVIWSLQSNFDDVIA